MVVVIEGLFEKEQPSNAESHTVLMHRDERTMLLPSGGVSKLESVAEVSQDTRQLALPDGSSLTVSKDKESGGIKLAFGFIGSSKTKSLVVEKHMIPARPSNGAYQLYTGRPMPDAQRYVQSRVGADGNGFSASYFKSKAASTARKIHPVVKPHKHLQSTSSSDRYKSIYVSTSLSRDTAQEFSNGDDLNGNDEVTYGALYTVNLPGNDLAFYKDEQGAVHISPTGSLAVLDLTSQHNEREFAFVGEIPRHYITQTEAFKGPLGAQRLKFTFVNEHFKKPNCLATMCFMR